MRNPKSNAFLLRVQSGEAKTVRQWEEEYCGEHTFQSKAIILGWIATLRKNGHSIYVVKVNGESQSGIVKCVESNKTLAIMAYNRHTSKVVEPRIESSFRLAEDIIVNHPTLRAKIIERAKGLLKLAADSQQKLLAIDYEPGYKRVEDRSGKSAKG